VNGLFLCRVFILPSWEVEGGFLKTVQCTVLPPEESKHKRPVFATTENGVPPCAIREWSCRISKNRETIFKIVSLIFLYAVIFINKDSSEWQMRSECLRKSGWSRKISRLRLAPARNDKDRMF
jgi:hypothetical protein